MRKRPAPEVVARAVSAVPPLPKSNCPSETEESPVPPPATGSPVALVRTRAEGVPRAGVTRVGEVERTTSPVPVHVKREEVAMAVTLDVEPVVLPSMELAAI